MLKNVNHVQISIPKGGENDARKFYCEFLGMREIPKPQALAGRGGFWAELNGFAVHFGAEDGVDRAATKAHIAYEVDDLAAWSRRLQERNVELQAGVAIPGFDRLEFRDPFGNRVEFMQPTS
jgi:catechol 2,3-dioxygenase-like lactoylglutathione lyase family enzyme